MTAFRPLLVRIQDHVKAHWQHHALLWGLLATLLTFLLGAGTGAAIAFVAKGGYHLGPLPTRIAVSRKLGGTLPASASLVPFIARIHNQGNSNSCVGQTAATIVEITNDERRAALGLPGHRAFSSGFIYNQINGGSDNGASYDDAFAVLRVQGDAHLSAFPHDGIDWWVTPTARAERDAAAHRVSTWRSIAPGDRYTISYELAHGRPVAIAIPVTDSFYDLWQDGHIPTVWSQSGRFHFYHSITGVAYDPVGVTILNSWGPRYGYHGLARLSWSFLQAVDAAVVVSTPAYPITPTPAPKPTVTPTPKATPKPTPRPTAGPILTKTLVAPAPTKTLVPTPQTGYPLAGVPTPRPQLPTTGAAWRPTDTPGWGP